MKDHNPSLFREMSEPHESREAMDAAADKFFELVTAARKECRIKNVAMVVEVVHVSDGEEREGYGVLRLGDGSASEAMFAYGYGVSKTQREELMGALLKGKR
jgi:hypothetical protein